MGGGLPGGTAQGSPDPVIDQDVSRTAIAGRGFPGFSTTGAALDGGTSVLQSFLGIDVGETSALIGDVDDVQVQQPWLNRSGLSGTAPAKRLADNATIAAPARRR